MKFFSKCRNFLDKLFCLSPLEIEIRRVKKSLDKHESILDDMNRSLRKDDCCIECLFGLSYFNTIDKIDRIRDQLELLENKLWHRNNGIKNNG